MKIFKISCLIAFLFLISGILGIAEGKKEEKKTDKKTEEKEKANDNSGATIRGEDKAENKADEKDKDSAKLRDEKNKKDVGMPWAETYDEIKNRLESIKMSFELKDKTIFEAVEYFQDILFIRFSITSKVYNEYNTKTVSVSLKNLEAKVALRLAISMYDLKCLYDDGALVIMAPDETVIGEYVTVIYRIDDLLAPPPEDFEGPQIDTNLGGTNGAFPIPPAMPPREKKNITKEEVEEAIKSQTGAKLWEDTKKVSLSITNQFLVVTQTKAVHKKVMEVLNTLRAAKR